MVNANIGKRAQRFDVISNFRCGDSEGGRYGVAEVAYGEHLFQPFTASYLFECVLESGVCCYLVLHRRRCLLAWQMTRHVLLPAKLSEGLRGRWKIQANDSGSWPNSQVPRARKGGKHNVRIYPSRCCYALYSVSLTGSGKLMLEALLFIVPVRGLVKSTATDMSLLALWK